MNTETCNFSGYKIYPGHGRKYVRSDMKAFVFINAKCEKAFLVKSNPRKVGWTQVYRKMHKKGTTAEVQKKKTRKIVKVQRNIVGASVEQIRQKRSQKPEIRAASREAVLKEIKERKKKREDLKKKSAPTAGKAAPAGAKAKAKAKPKPKPQGPSKAAARAGTKPNLKGR